MATDRRDLARDLEEETRTEDVRQARHRKGSRVLTLTVLAHPESSRVGEEAVLCSEAAGQHRTLSRREPLFARPSSDGERPLAEPHLSRQPWSVTTLPGGAVRLEAGRSRTRVLVNGRAVEEGRTELAPSDLQQGVVLELGGTVVLLLKTADCREEAASLPRYGLVGESPAIVDLRQEIRQAGDFKVPVLLRGETGTGKELVARALHDAGPRARAPFVSVNVAAIPPDLVAAELFGTTAGAFTGAGRPRLGYFRRAEGGTLFLDEIGDVSLSVQTALLRALETGEIQAVGSSRTITVDVRVVAASDADLEDAVDRGVFRAPLLHRLAGYEIEVPPLRERREDIGRLLIHFLREELEETGELGKLDPPPEGRVPWLPADLVAKVAMLDWPGNVRQLRNLARQLVIGSRGVSELRLTRGVQRLIDQESVRRDPPSEPRAGPLPPRGGYRDPHRISEDELLEALRSHRFRIKPTAQHLNVARSSLYDLIDRSGRVRKASELKRSEVMAAVEEHGDDLLAMAAELEVSPEGLRRRLRELGLL